MNKYEIIVDLNITDFTCDPRELTEALGVQPTRAWRKGELKNPRAIVRHEENGWELSSGAGSHKSFEQHTEALLGIIEPALDKFTEVCNRYDTRLLVVASMYYDNEERLPWLGFNRRAMRIFTQIGAAVDFDLYVLP